MDLILYWPLLLKGTVTTLSAWIAAGILSLLIGILVGIISCRKLAAPTTTIIVNAYTFIAKGIPGYVQILIAYFVIPALLEVKIPGIIAAVGALAFCSSGYVTEIVRAGINSIAPGQWDACFVLGYPLRSTMWRIILPQTFRSIFPALRGEMEQLLKSTSLLAAIGITELTRTGMNIISRELNPIPVYLMIAAIYLLFSALLHIVSIIYNRKDHYGSR